MKRKWFDVAEERFAATVRRAGPLLVARLGRAVMVLTLVAGGPSTVYAADEGAAPAAEETGSAAGARTRHPPRSAIGSRVQLMTKELNLDAGQQTKLTTILETQRAEVVKVWSDTSVSAAIRVAATQAIGDKTADRIRAILNDEQRKKYIKPREHEAPVGAPGGDVQKWMNTAQGLERPSNAAAPAAAKGK